MPFQEFVFNRIEDQLIAFIAKEQLSGKSLRVIRKQNPIIRRSELITISSQLRGTLYGFLFEDWYALSIGVPLEFFNEIVQHSEHGADIIWEDIVYSLKFTLKAKRNKAKTYKKADFLPEIKEALERNTTFTFVFYNPNWSDVPLKKIIDPKTFRDRITVDHTTITVDPLQT